MSSPNVGPDYLSETGNTCDNEVQYQLILDKNGILLYGSAIKLNIFANNMENQFRIPHMTSWVDDVGDEIIDHDNN